MTSENSTFDAPILIAGGRGYIGSALVGALNARGIASVIVSRTGGGVHCGAPVIAYSDLTANTRCSGVINLAGANIAQKRWSPGRKQELLSSRLGPTRSLSDWARHCVNPPEFFINASAIGFYGDTADEAVDENAASGEGFGAALCQEWEASVSPPAGVRTVILRIGVVVGAGGGALDRMVPPFRLGLGGPIGSGRQWMSWIALDDLIACLLQAIQQPWHGVLNATAPHPVRNLDFARTLGAVLGRPALIPLPQVIVKLLFGEMSELLLNSQRVLPSRLETLGFEFQHAELQSALEEALER